MNNFNDLTWTEKTHVVENFKDAISKDFELWKEKLCTLGYGIGYSKGIHYITGTDFKGDHIDITVASYAKLIFHMAAICARDPRVPYLFNHSLV
jgi:hypothetical protein